MRSLDKLGMTTWGIWVDSLLSGITEDPSTTLRMTFWVSDLTGWRMVWSMGNGE